MIKTKRSAQDAVYDVLATLKGGIALTSKEIYNDLEPADQGLFVGGVDGVMKSINKLHTRGIVINGNSEIVNGRVVKTWRLKDEVSTDKPVVDALSATPEAEKVAKEMLETETKERQQFDRVYRTEAEREYFDGFAYPKDSTNSFESLIEEAQDTAILSISNVFNGLIEQLHVVAPKHEGIDELIDGLLQVSDLLSEKIAVKNIIPVIEFLRGLK